MRAPKLWWEWSDTPVRFACRPVGEVNLAGVGDEGKGRRRDKETKGRDDNLLCRRWKVRRGHERLRLRDSTFAISFTSYGDHGRPRVHEVGRERF